MGNIYVHFITSHTTVFHDLSIVCLVLNYQKSMVNSRSRSMRDDFDYCKVSIDIFQNIGRRLEGFLFIFYIFACFFFLLQGSIIFIGYMTACGHSVVEEQTSSLKHRRDGLN